MQQIDTDAVAGDALLTDPQVIALYEAVRAALVEDSDQGGDPLTALTRLCAMMESGQSEAAYAIFMLYCLKFDIIRNDDIFRSRRVRRRTCDEQS